MQTKIQLQTLRSWQPGPGRWPGAITYLYQPTILDTVDNILDAELSSMGMTYAYTEALRATEVTDQLMTLFRPYVRKSLYRNGFPELAQPKVIDCLTYSFLKSFLESRNESH